MLPGPAFATAMLYVPLRAVPNVPALLKALKVSYIEKEESYEDDFGETGEAEKLGMTEYEEVVCYDLDIPGYIGVPRHWGMKEFSHLPYVDRTVLKQKQPELFRHSIKARDEAQRAFWEELRSILDQPGPQDVVANARTGTGKTISALWMLEEVIQAPMLVTVPNNFLRAQWNERIVDTMGRTWAQKYVGHIQQDIMDYEGRLITIGLAPSLAIRNYPLELRRHHTAILFDEWHKVGAPRMSLVLRKYPARVRIGLTATNRRDALLRVCTLHLGKPRVKSTQEVMHPQVYVAKYRRTLSPRFRIASEFHMITALSQFHDRNEMLANILLDYGWHRDRHVVALSDRTDQLVTMRALLIERGVPPENVGILCGTYKRPIFDEYAGRTVVKKIAMSDDEKAHIAGTCNIILTTWGQFDTGADIDRLDMGVELTPRGNLRQGIGRILRIKEGKETPEWYGVDDDIMHYVETGTTLFADPRPVAYTPLHDLAAARRASYEFQRGTVNEL